MPSIKQKISPLNDVPLIALISKSNFSGNANDCLISGMKEERHTRAVLIRVAVKINQISPQ